MKHFHTFVFILLATLAGKAQQPNTDWYDGDKNSFTITTSEELAGLADLVNDGNSFNGKTITLGEDIDLSGFLSGHSYSDRGWRPIGSSSNHPFNGTFDGNHKQISGLWLNPNATSSQDRYANSGLFGVTGSNAVISDLTVVINNSSNERRLRGARVIGGLVGSNGGSIIGCAVQSSNPSNLAIRATRTAGGLVGVNSGTIECCYATVNVENDEDNGDNAGGLVGSNEGRISNCYATGTVDSESYAGGIAGYNDGGISNCYAIGSVDGQTGRKGGLVGRADEDSRITASFFNSNVNSGLNVAGSSDRDSRTTGSSGKSTSSMKSIGLYTDRDLGSNKWNFNTIWGIKGSINNGYPYLLPRFAVVTLEGTDDDNFMYVVGEDEEIEAGKDFKVTKGNSFSFSIVPDEGYTSENVVVTVSGLGDEPITLTPSEESVYTIDNVTGDCSVSVEGIDLITATVTLAGTDDDNFIYLMEDDEEIEAGKDFEVVLGNSFSFAIGSDEGYTSENAVVTVSGLGDEPITLTPSEEGVYTIDNVTDDCSVSVEGIDLITATVTLAGTDDDNFIYLMEDDEEIEAGEDFEVVLGNSFSFAIVPDEGFTLADATAVVTGAEGEVIDELSSPTFDGKFSLNVGEDCTITIEGIKAISPVSQTHTVTLITGEGVVVDKSKKTFEVQSGDPFSFLITLAKGYEGYTPNVTINDTPSRIITTVESVKWRCIIGEVNEPLEVKVHLDGFTGNEDPDAPRLYSQEGQLFVETAEPVDLSVFTVAGQVVVSRHIMEGLTTIPLPGNVYIVKMGNVVEKIVIKK